MKRYIVETCFKPGHWVELLSTNNYDRAVEKTNFWDDRQDTRLVDLACLSPLDLAMRKFDAAIRQLRPEQINGR